MSKRNVGTVPQLMTMLAKVTGWGDQSLSVSIGCKRARIRTGQSESHLDDNDVGFTASTTICSTEKDKISAQGKTLEEALWNLGHEVEDHCISRQGGWAGRAHAASEAIEAHKAEVKAVNA